MKAQEIHAYLNDDGTYRIEMIGKVKYDTINIGGYLCGETVESRTEVPRALIHIDALASMDDNKVLATLILGGDSDELS